MIAAIHAANRQLGLDEDTARDLYERITGKRSLRQMNGSEHQRILQEQRRQGFKPAEKGLQGPYAKKLQALWIGAWNLGIVSDRRDSAMLAFVKRQTGIDHTRFLIDAGDARKAVEALKAWMKREARVDWGDGLDVAEWLRQPGAQIAVAQWQILARAGEMEQKISAFRSLVATLVRPVDQMTERDWPMVMNAMGERVRKVAS